MFVFIYFFINYLNPFVCFVPQVSYVLGLLLVGKQRKHVQKELAQLQLIPKLSNLFDRQVLAYSCCIIMAVDPGEKIFREKDKKEKCEEIAICDNWRFIITFTVKLDQFHGF